MPTKNPPRPAGDPQERLAQLLARLHHNDETKNAGAAYQTRGDIREHCQAHGLEVPEEARKRSVPPPTAAQRPKLPKVKAAEHPEGDPAKLEIARSIAYATPSFVAANEELARRGCLMAPIGGDPAASPTPAARIRGLRSQALDILPDLENLTEDQAREVRRELALLSETLVLGSHLSERSA